MEVKHAFPYRWKISETNFTKDKGTVRELSKKYGISKTQIGYIKQSKRWME